VSGSWVACATLELYSQLSSTSAALVILVVERSELACWAAGCMTHSSTVNA
jgi:hypothetical protein